MNQTKKSACTTQLIAIVCMVLLPGLITMVAPRTGLEFSKSASGTSVTVTRYVWLFVPWRTVEVDRVSRLDVEVTPRARHANTAENRRKGRAGAVHLATGQLTVVGADVQLVVQVSPETSHVVAGHFKRFTEEPDARAQRISVYASWGLTYVLGGVMSLLTALYVFGAVARIVQHLLQAPRLIAATR
jgi:hypothetical protein